MRSIATRIFGSLLVIAALAASAPQAIAAPGVCNLLCIQGFHCKIIHHEPTCVPNHP